MIEESLWSVDPFDTPGGAGGWLGVLRRLPQPLHLLEFVSSSQHYHFGCFESPGEQLARAQDRMSLWGARHFAPGSSVVDIGCGLGGTSELLSRLGLQVTAIDPCHEALAYARMRGRNSATNGRPRYVGRTLESYVRTAGAAADGALAIEILQHFPDLARFFDDCRRLLHPDASLVLHDLSTAEDIQWSRAFFHRRGRIQAAAEAAGFRLVEQQDLSRATLPTLPAWSAALEARRAELIDAFDGDGQGHRPVERELAQLLAHMRALHQALEHGDLVYETLVFRAGLPR